VRWNKKKLPGFNREDGSASSTAIRLKEKLITRTFE